MGWVMFFIAFIVCFTIGVVMAAFQPMTKNVEKWCEMRKSLSNDKKEIEMRRLDVLEKTPELRQLIFHPKMIEKEEK